jgi:hypothetical protein
MNGQTQPSQSPGATLAAVKAPEEFERLLNKQHLPVGVFDDPKEFAHAQRVAKMLVGSQLMPEHFRGDENLGSAVIAVDIAFRLRLNPLLVAQQIYMVHGRPGFSAQFVIAVMNTSAKFGKLRYDVKDQGEKKVTATFTEWLGGQKTRKTAELTIQDQQCTAWTLDGNNELPKGINTLQAAREAGLAVLEGPAVSVEMAVKEGWYVKDGSKWPTMPGLMLRYRAATFFGRLYAPELTMGLPTVDELEDMPPAEPTFTRPVFSQQLERAKAMQGANPPSPTLYLEGANPPATSVPKPPPEITPSPPPEAAGPPVAIEPPPAAPTSPEATQAPPEVIHFNALQAIRGLCKNESPVVKEDQLIEFLKTIRCVKDDVSSLEEIHLADDRVLGMVCEQWSELSKRIKEK